MSIKSDRNRNKSKNYYPIIDDITGFRISSRDVTTTYTGSLTHKKNIKKGPTPLEQGMVVPLDDAQQDGPVRPDKLLWSSRELYDFESDVLFNDLNYRTASGYNSVAVNPQIALLQSRNPTYWNTVNGTWNDTLMQFVNRTYNQGIQFIPDTITSTWGDDLTPTFIQFQPE